MRFEAAGAPTRLVTKTKKNMAIRSKMTIGTAAAAMLLIGVLPAGAQSGNHGQAFDRVHETPGAFRLPTRHLLEQGRGSYCLID
ncbi:hypothetical protein ACQKOH_11830 [Sphingomonas sp. NPDC092331]|jgi:hypothetical protein|uniref:hypothetical protein n=1 Tax=unclassified Sphingomonas TaxID=196159 RepID=UPI0031F4CEF7